MKTHSNSSTYEVVQRTVNAPVLLVPCVTIIFIFPFVFQGSLAGTTERSARIERQTRCDYAVQHTQTVHEEQPRRDGKPRNVF